MGFARFNVSTRIAIGFGTLIVLSLALAGFGVFQLSDVGGEAGKMNALAGNVQRVLDATHRLEAIRRAETRARLDGAESAFADATENTAAADKLMIESGQATLSEERRRTYAGVQTLLHTHEEALGRFTQLVKTASERRASLFTGGDTLTAASNRVVDAARATRDPAVAEAAANVNSAVLLVRVANWRFMATMDKAGPETFRINSQKATAALDALKPIASPDAAALIVPTQAALTAYETDFKAYSAARLGSEALFEETMRSQIASMQQQLDTASASLKTGFDAASAQSAAIVANASWLQEIMAVLGLVIGAALAFFIGRGISRPLAGMTEAMTKLAAGDRSVDVPARENTDEIGAMARAVEVFKQNAIERARLEVEQKAQEERATREKNAALVGMAEKIELESGAAMDAVSRRTATIAENAEEMNASATRTGESAQGAATAAAQAMANVQTVASAAEQLAASIREIGGQVNQSTTVVGRAVAAGTEARNTMEALNEQVGRIGAVADMISEIAGKTNLLALNATIEAARAGDAGKGFAVVASEVKQLATQTARSTQEITRHIGEVRNATNASVAAVGRIEHTIGEINAIAGSIAAAVEEQGAATAEIARNVSETAAAANQMTLRINEVSAEAERTGQRSSQVREDTASLNTMVGELKLAVVRVVRTSTAEVDRREHTRYPMNLGCRISVAGLGSHDARVSDISEGGAAVSGAPALSNGARGSLEVDRVGMKLPFIVRAAQGDTAHLTFELSPADSAKLAQILGQMEPRRAA